jgi:hypothetical protein
MQLRFAILFLILLLHIANDCEAKREKYKIFVRNSSRLGKVNVKAVNRLDDPLRALAAF